MNDPLKKFVKQHREEFDHLEPPAEISDRIRHNLKPVKPAGRRGKMPKIGQWGIAASIFIALGIGLYIFLPKEEPIHQEITIKDNISVHPAETIVQSSKETDIDNLAETESYESPSVPKKAVKETIQIAEAEHDIYMEEKDAILLLLADEQSASTRIEGMLKANNLSRIDEGLMDILANSAAEDANSNVRLAAIEVMVSHIHEPSVAEKIVQAFVTQDDPVVQAELIHIISRMDSARINDEVKHKLYALTEDPSTMGFVKDGAYAVLMNY